MNKAQEINFYVEWPEDGMRDEELYELLEEAFSKHFCGEPHPKECPYYWTMSGFIHDAEDIYCLARSSRVNDEDISHLKSHVYVDLEWLHEDYPDDDRITQAMELMKQVDDERVKKQ